MKPQPLILALLCCALCLPTAHAQDVDKELSNLANKLAAAIKAEGKKKVAVIDFTDLQDRGSELGKYIAEELTVNLVMVKKDFSVLDRANLRKILAEHKLTATGLVDPENAKKLGMFAGVDAFILGTIVPKGKLIALNAKILSVETAEILGAQKAEFENDDQVQKLVSQPAAVGVPSAKAQVVKTFGDLVVELNTLTIANGRNYALDFALKNQNKSKSIWVALSVEPNGITRVGLTDPGRFDFRSQMNFVTGIECATRYDDGAFYKSTEIKPGESLSGSIQFISVGGRTAAPGICGVQLEFLVSNSFNATVGGIATAHNVNVKMEAK